MKMEELILSRLMLKKLQTLPFLLGIIVISGCTLASPFKELEAYVNEEDEEVAQVQKTIQPTFTLTPALTPTPTKTTTPTPSPIPTDTPTPIPPTDTPTPAPTDTPVPTDTPGPSWDYQLAELYSQPTEANILSIMVAIQNHNGDYISGVRVVGVDPNGTVTKSEISAGEVIGYTPPGDVVKSGNAKFEPISNYVTGTWMIHLETPDGTQITETHPVSMDADNRSWYFIRFQPL